ncbi:hypothetical protein TG4357_02597 [Thalassovita gelatinovora]|uniref:Oxidoreductase probably involved in sulfite reduction n=1 Tax=Thalassovita gelatinovora TaxID=53501 RepID=A0A0P1FEY1_THAGE|nr:DUF934 domain-containing protein [Thalassovita gelatinovora]QIZ79727.1 DUF934 domain-containing protein [Thalassovita gelatinovora]CUH66718.1 hypothetical protein TG4357_02597 [Thalassovita gelatinovora]SEQ41550.1 protein of unknown function [Thalassovita gelatinovora]
MSVIVTDTGFQADDFTGEFVAFSDVNDATDAIDLGPDADPHDLADRLPALQMIRVDFPSFADGRGFTIARQLRLMGYRGRLRATGHVISDQYTMARRSGFDEVEISDDQAARQPETEWTFRANWHSHDYQTRLRAG